MDSYPGKLDIILGTMFSGKTTYLLSKLSSYSALNFSILYINIDIDTRSTKSFSTHNSFMNLITKDDSQNTIKNVTMLKLKNLKSIDIEQYDIIMIDEAHFFDDIIEFTKMALNNNKHVIIGSLIADFKGNKFGKVLDLITICDNVERLHAYCSECAKNKFCRIATYSKRITKSKKNIDIGGSDKYIPVCRDHYNFNDKLNKITYETIENSNEQSCNLIENSNEQSCNLVELLPNLTITD
jgi:thymidine kinase